MYTIYTYNTYTGNIMSMVSDPKNLLPYMASLLPGLKECLVDPIPDVCMTYTYYMLYTVYAICCILYMHAIYYIFGLQPDTG